MELCEMDEKNMKLDFALQWSIEHVIETVVQTSVISASNVSKSHKLL
jgi:hypothetical protein